MVRKKRRRNYESEDNSNEEFDDSFIVPGEETFFIDNQEIVVEDAVHLIKDGQEFVIINDQSYPIDRSDGESNVDNEELTFNQQYEQTAAPSSGFGKIGIIIVAVIVGAIVFLFAGPFIGFVSGHSES
jgi:hypothetical protein